RSVRRGDLRLVEVERYLLRSHGSALVVRNRRLLHRNGHSVTFPANLVRLTRSGVRDRDCQVRQVIVILSELRPGVLVNGERPAIHGLEPLKVLVRIGRDAALEAQTLGWAALGLQASPDCLSLPLGQLLLSLDLENHLVWKEVSWIRHFMFLISSSTASRAAITWFRAFGVILRAACVIPLDHGPRRSLMSARSWLSLLPSGSSSSTISPSMMSSGL